MASMCLSGSACSLFVKGDAGLPYPPPGQGRMCAKQRQSGPSTGHLLLWASRE